MRKKMLTLVFLFCTTFGFAQNIGDLPLTQKVDLLNGRATLMVPAGAVNTPMGGDIMAARESNEEMTRIILDTAGRLVLFANDLHAVSKNDLAAVFKVQQDKLGCRLLPAGDSMQAVVCPPSKEEIDLPADQNALLIGELWVRMPDHSVFKVGAYVDRVGMARIGEFRQLAQRIFSSIVKGPRRLMLKPRTETVSILGGGATLKVPLPANYALVKKEGEDFDVLKVYRLMDITDTVVAQATLYAGFNPSSYAYPQMGIDEKEIKKVPGKFAARPIQWLYAPQPQTQFFLKEQQIPAETIQKGLVFHIIMQSSSAGTIGELTKIMEGVSINKK